VHEDIKVGCETRVKFSIGNNVRDFLIHPPPPPQAFITLPVLHRWALQQNLSHRVGKVSLWLAWRWKPWNLHRSGINQGAWGKFLSQLSPSPLSYIHHSGEEVGQQDTKAWSFFISQGW